MAMFDSPGVAHLTLARHPFKTLYYFSCSVANGTASAAHFIATHPVTLGMALPILLLYAGAKVLGLYGDATGLLEVRWCCAGWALHGRKGVHAGCCRLAPMLAAAHLLKLLAISPSLAHNSTHNKAFREVFNTRITPS
jgi:hypothetical protein